jgi:hypothetical protein
MTDEQYQAWFEARHGHKPNAFQIRLRVGMPQRKGIVQPDVQFYRSYRSPNTIVLTGSVQARRDAIRRADIEAYGEEAGLRREPENLT